MLDSARLHPRMIDAAEVVAVAEEVVIILAAPGSLTLPNIAGSTAPVATMDPSVAPRHLDTQTPPLYSTKWVAAPKIPDGVGRS
jgi:hypothetical protein